MRRALPWLAGITLGTLLCCGQATQNGAHGEDVRIPAADGMLLAATVYRASSDYAAGLLLLHGLGSNRQAWEPLAFQARQAGFTILAVDLRGHGESTRSPNGEAVTHRRFGPEDWQRVSGDVATAKAALLGFGADPDNIAFIGADIGANLALQCAAADAGVEAVVLLSPALSQNGIDAERAIESYGNRPCLLVCAEGDSYAALSCATLKKQAPGFIDLQMYAGSAHGTDLLAAMPLATDQILLWLKEIIGPEAAAMNRTRREASEGRASPLSGP